MGLWGTVLISSLLVLLGLQLSPAAGEAWKVFSYRELALLTILATSTATEQWLRMKSQLTTLNHTLENQGKDRTRILEDANQALAQKILEGEEIDCSLQQREERPSLVIQGSNEGLWD